MTLRLNGSTSGYVEIDAPAVAANNTLTLPSSGELVAATSGNIDVTSINNLNYPTAGPLSNRNLIINGAMEVWQRGASQTTSGGYGADRFWMASATSATRSTDAPAGFTYSTKLTYNASDMAMGQPIELPATGEQGQLVAGETFTLSYYAKVDSGTEGIQTSINFRDSKFSSTNQVSFTSSNPNATWTTTWTRYTHQFTVPTVGSTNVLAGLEISGISKDAYITGVQLERGSVATPFEHRSYGDELVKCQRYFEKSFPQGVAPAHNTGYARFQPHSGNAGCGGNTYWTVEYKTTKRDNCTIRIYDPSGTGTATTNLFRVYTACDAGIQGTNAPGISAATDAYFTGYTQYASAVTTAFHWTAEAEL